MTMSMTMSKGWAPETGGMDFARWAGNGSWNGVWALYDDSMDAMSQSTSTPTTMSSPATGPTSMSPTSADDGSTNMSGSRDDGVGRWGGQDGTDVTDGSGENSSMSSPTSMASPASNDSMTSGSNSTVVGDDSRGSINQHTMTRWGGICHCKAGYYGNQL